MPRSSQVRIAKERMAKVQIVKDQIVKTIEGRKQQNAAGGSAKESEEETPQ